MNDLYPWQYKDYTTLSKMYQYPSHAFLVTSMRGIGQDRLVKSYIALLMCDQPKIIDQVPYACTTCQSCKLFMSDNHPDYYDLAVNSEEDKKSINVEDVRKMIGFVATSTHISRYKIVRIPGADLLSINTANALLKILEEPQAYVLFILQTYNISGILPTILSRCHKYQLSHVNASDALAYVEGTAGFNPEFWLTYYDHAPLFELEVTEDQFNSLMKALLRPSIENIFLASAQFDAKDAAFLISFLSHWLRDIVCCMQNASIKYFVSYEAQMTDLVKRIDKHGVFYLSDKVNFLEMWVLHPLNFRLQLENLLLQYQSLFLNP